MKLHFYGLICTQQETREALSPGRSTANAWIPAEYSIFSVPASSKLNRQHHARFDPNAMPVATATSLLNPELSRKLPAATHRAAPRCAR